MSAQDPSQSRFLVSSFGAAFSLKSFSSAQAFEVASPRHGGDLRHSLCSPVLSVGLSVTEIGSSEEGKGQHRCCYESEMPPYLGLRRSRPSCWLT